MYGTEWTIIIIILFPPNFLHFLISVSHQTRVIQSPVLSLSDQQASFLTALQKWKENLRMSKYWTQLLKTTVCEHKQNMIRTNMGVTSPPSESTLSSVLEALQRWTWLPQPDLSDLIPPSAGYRRAHSDPPLRASPSQSWCSDSSHTSQMWTDRDGQSTDEWRKSSCVGSSGEPGREPRACRRSQPNQGRSPKTHTLLLLLWL